MSSLQKFLKQNAPVGALLQMVASFVCLADGRIFIVDLAERCTHKLGVDRIPVRMLDREERVIVQSLLKSGYDWVADNGHYRLAAVSFEAMKLQMMYDAAVRRLSC